MPFAVFAAMGGGNVALVGDLRGEAVLGGQFPFGTGFRNHFAAFPFDVKFFSIP
jgi:hypothetical protein